MFYLQFFKKKPITYKTHCFLSHIQHIPNYYDIGQFKGAFKLTKAFAYEY